MIKYDPDQLAQEIVARFNPEQLIGLLDALLAHASWAQQARIYQWADATEYLPEPDIDDSLPDWAEYYSNWGDYMASEYPEILNPDIDE